MEQFVIDLKGQNADEASYCWKLNDDFFLETEGSEIQHGSVDVSLSVRRLTAVEYDLRFLYRGQVVVLCDRCMEPMQLPIDGESNIKVLLGQVTDDDGERLTTADGTVNLAWNLYEMMALQIPLRHVHRDGECKGETAEALRRYIADENTIQPTDPRWDELKKINNK